MSRCSLSWMKYYLPTEVNFEICLFIRFDLFIYLLCLLVVIEIKEEEACNAKNVPWLVRRELIEIRDTYPVPIIDMENPWKFKKKIDEYDFTQTGLLIPFLVAFEHIIRYWKLPDGKTLVNGNWWNVVLCDVTEENDLKKYDGASGRSFRFGNMSDDDYFLQCRQLFIDRGLSVDNVRNHIMNETYARSLRDKLETLYASKTGNNKLFLLKKLMNIRYKEGNPIFFYHINDFQDVLDQLSGMGVKFDEAIQGLWLLNTLPDSWETLRVSLTNSAPSGIVTMKYVKSDVLNEEMRRRSQASSSSSSHFDILVTEERGRNKSRDSNDRD
ncbi:hypothetical protein FXO37_14702 [Capsicum annuum]|nr:hypothetical protein FXO37_14702 [Capsicum annuum]